VSEVASGEWVQEALGLEKVSVKESARELAVPDCRNQHCSGKP
jgi:hypothetical protein